MVLFAFLGWLGFFLFARELSARGKIADDIRVHWLGATIAWGVWVALSLELCSVFEQLRRPVIAWSWVGLAAATFTATWFIRHRPGEALSPPFNLRWRERFRFDEAGLLDLGVVALAITLFGIAVAIPPTNWDSLTYHLPRVLHWIDQHHLRHFATDNVREIEFAPWSAFALTHLYLLAGSDAWLNLVQWGAMVTTVVLIGLLVDELALAGGLNVAEDEAGSRRLALIRAAARFLVITLPIGIVESTSTQNDYITTCWMVCMCILLLRWMRNAQNPIHALGASAALGLAVLTKPTSYIYAAPIVVVGALLILRKTKGTARKFGHVAIVFSVFALLNAPHMLRNYSLVGSPLGSPLIMKLERNERVTLGTLASGVIRNLALHSNCGIPLVTHTLNRILSAAHALTGEALSDPATTYNIGKFEFKERFRVFDSYASCTGHVLLFLLTGAMLFARWRRYPGSLAATALLILSMVLFCGSLKWQWWHIRIHLAYLILFVPCMAFVLIQEFPKLFRRATFILLTASAIATVAKNESAPVFRRTFWQLPRELRYMALSNPGLNEPTRWVSELIARADVKSVGLKFGFYEAEYPLVQMLRNRGFRGSVHHVLVENESARLLDPVEPDIIVTLGAAVPEGLARRFPFVYDAGIMVYSKKRLIPAQTADRPVPPSTPLRTD